MVSPSIKSGSCYVLLLLVIIVAGFANLSDRRCWSLLSNAGEGMSELTLADRATIANMSPEYGATMGFFPVDHVTLQYLKLTGRNVDTVSHY